jgi:hypothetical protein
MASYEVLPGLPSSGPIALAFDAGGWTGAWGPHREGFVVRFQYTPTMDWVGNFQPGGGGWNGVFQHPDGHSIIVVARGQGYLVDPELRQVVSRFSGGIQHVVSLPEFGAVVISDGLGFEAIRNDGIWWRSPRVSWDKIRNINIDGTILRGEASIPTSTGAKWSTFTVDLMTGNCVDSTFQNQMSRAIPIKPDQE